MVTNCQYEFQAKHFGFKDCDPARFYKSQWSENRWIFFGFKLFLLIYWLAWFISGFIVLESISRWWIFLTNWGVIILLLYFIVSFIVATYGVINQHKEARIGPTVPTLIHNVSGEITTVAANSAVRSKPELRWFHIIVWIFHQVAFAIALYITVVYWSLLTSNFGPYSINAHLMNLVVMLMDLFMSDIPLRVLHFYHLSLTGTIYTIFSLILHGSGYESAIYPILDWQGRAGFAIGISLLTIFVFAPLCHLVGFSLFQLRWFIARQLRLADDERMIIIKPATVTVVSGVAVNHAFIA